MLDADLPIIDSHHHLWDLTALLPALAGITHPFARMIEAHSQYLVEDLDADCRSGGHKVVATVFIECHSFYRTGGPEHLKPVGEIERVRDLAERTATGSGFEACAAIVGYANLTLGTAAGEILDSEMEAGKGRFRGIRHIGAHDPDPEVLGPLAHAGPGLFSDARFREGFAEVGKRGLTFDAWVLEPQIAEVTALARAFPDQPIVLNHGGTPLGLGRYSGRQDERFGAWKTAIGELAHCPNVSVKLGGLAMPFSALGGLGPETRPDAEMLANLYRPYIETCIEAFGASRAMFESNYPVDAWGAGYGTIWSAFKLLARGASEDEKRKLFAGTAARFYSLDCLGCLEMPQFETGAEAVR